MRSQSDDILLLKGNEIARLLDGREDAIMQAVEHAYRAHGAGHTSLPQSCFLRFGESSPNRIIALPAFIGGEVQCAGIKWIASFPGNHARRMDRASAVIVLNSLETGRAEAILEGSVISAKRTAASAVVAARLLARAGADTAGMIGCGYINFEIAGFLRASFPGVRRLVLFDLSPAKAAAFGALLSAEWPALRVEVASSVSAVLRQAELISLATTASAPHISDLSMCAPTAVLLHVSLRDLAPEAILGCDNIVDDVAHVCQAQTSVHLAAQMTGGRSFIRATLADLLTGGEPVRTDPVRTAVFSPFGLGVLDLALSHLVTEIAAPENAGIRIDSFFPDSWLYSEAAPACSA
jgi:ornithine cyclodeaminase